MRMALQHHLATLIIVVTFIVVGPRAVSGLNATFMRRQTADDGLIDASTMPPCESSYCQTAIDPALNPCIPEDSPCHPDNNNGNTCVAQEYTRDCYCNLRTGLFCAWACPWDPWWAIEDWFSDNCPGSPAAVPLDFSGLPRCARECFDDEIFATGCITQSSNCFCAWGDLFGCHENCRNAEELSQIEDWLRDVCDLDEEDASTALEQGAIPIRGEDIEELGEGQRDSRPRTFSRWQPSWDEVFIFVVLGITGLVAFGLWVYSCVANRNRGRGDRGNSEVVEMLQK